MKASGRNYQIDVIKFILTIFVFLNHTLDFKKGMPLGEIFFTGGLGWISVHYFFVISGFLMVKSCVKAQEKGRISAHGRSTVSFVMRKFGSVALQYYTSFAVALGVYLVTVRERLSVGFLSDLSFRLLPELFLLNRAGIDPIYINLPTWYIQSMLLCMIPMYYLLSRNKDLFLNIISPLGAILCISYMFRQPSVFIDAKGAEQLLTNGMIRGFCGLFCGCVAYAVYDRIISYDYTKAQRRMFTAVEAVLYVWLFVGCFTPHAGKNGHFLAMLLMIPATALTFSGASGIGTLFRSPKLGMLNSAALAIYFNNWTARRIILTYMPDMSWKRSTLYMAAITIILCIVCALLMKLCRIVWEKWLKGLFSFRPIKNEV